MPGKKHIDRPERPPGFRFSFWEIIRFILVVGGIGAGCIYLDILRKREELTACQMDLNKIRGEVEGTRKRVELRRGEISKLRENVNLLESLEQQKSALGTQVPDVERQLASWRTQLVTAVREERSKAVGSMQPELRLVDGEVLTGIRIMSVSDSEMSIAHAGGVARVPATRLPADFQDRFRFGMDLSDATGTAQVPSPANAGESPPPGYFRLTDSQRKRVDSLSADLRAKKARLQALEKKAARESEAESPAKSEGSKPGRASSEQQKIQMDRDKQRKAVDQHVRKAEIIAYTREKNALQKEIAAIEAEITMIYQGGQ